MQADANILELISEGKLAEAIQEMHNLLEGRIEDPYSKELLLLDGQYRKLIEDKRRGLISDENFNVLHSKLTYSAIQLYEKLEEEGKESIDDDKPDSETSGISLWSVEGELIRAFGFPNMKLRRVVFHPDGRSVLASSEPSLNLISRGGAQVSLWSTEGKMLRTYEPDEMGVAAVALSPDGEAILAVGDEGRGTQWEASGKKIAEYDLGNDSINDIVYSPDKRTFMTGSDASTAQLWSARGRELATFVPDNNLARVGPFGKLNRPPFISVLPERARLVGLEVRAGLLIDQLKLSYRLGKEEQAIVIGGRGGEAQPTFWINSPITKITGRAGDQLDQVQFHFEDGTSTPVYGGGGGQPFSVSFTEYEFAGFFGRADIVICQLGFFGKALAQRSY